MIFNGLSQFMQDIYYPIGVATVQRTCMFFKENPRHAGI